MKESSVTRDRFINKDGFFSPELISFAESQAGSILLETTKPDLQNHRNYLFTNPVRIVKAQSSAAVDRCFEEITSATRQGYYAAGYIAYEAGYAFEKKLLTEPLSDKPLLWFGIYEKPATYDHLTKRFDGLNRLARLVESNDEVPASTVHSIHPSLDQHQYLTNVKTVKNYIVEGDTYQVNYTFKLKFGYHGSAARLYALLRNTQHVDYSAFLRLEDASILSFSPELFFRIDGNTVTLRPMKGTAVRGRTLLEDERQCQELSRSEKNRAENLMIVDLLRNDVGRIARVGTVKVRKFFEIEKYDTVFQATSTIQANLRKGVGAAEIIRSLFPSGSVTGAPKIRTMQIIHELEKEPRAVYTGAIGFFGPRKRALFNVAIRTVVIDDRTQAAEMGVGSGIVHDSVPEDEYCECLLKARFLIEPADDFQLIETIRWDSVRGWFLLNEHLRRLKDSSSYFDFRYNRRYIVEALRKCGKQFEKKRDTKLKIRLRLHRNSDFDISDSPLQFFVEPQHSAISERRTNSSDRFLFHKTTNRVLYDESMQKAKELGLFDMIFLNELEELTEGARSNLIIKKSSKHFTPPVACGLLQGVYREHLFRKKTIPIEEKILHIEDLRNADGVYLCNAVRGMVKVQVVDVNNRKESSNAQLLAVEN